MYIEHEDEQVLLTTSEALLIKHLFWALWKLKLAHMDDFLKAGNLWSSAWYQQHLDSLNERGV